MVSITSEIDHLIHLPRMLALIWGASKRYTALWLVLLGVQGAMPIATVLLIRQLVDKLIQNVGDGASWEAFSPLLALVGLLAGIMLLTELIGSLIDWIRTAQSEYLQDHISSLVHDKSASLDMAFYESPEYYDQLERARNDANTRALAILENSGSLLQNGVTLVAMGALLIPFGIWLPGVLLLSTFPALYALVKSSRRFHRFWHTTTPDRRWVNYYDWMLTRSEIAAELRLFDLGGPFQSAFQTLRKSLRSRRIEIAKYQSTIRFVAAASALLISGAAMGWMVWRALVGMVTIGDLVLFYQAFNRGGTVMRTVVGNLGQIYTNSLFVKDLFEFLELKPKIVSPPNPVAVVNPPRQGIRFRDVCFSYPGSERQTLNNFNLTIDAGTTIAIVGANGTGKSTLVKLLCRFYDPQHGSIEFDGVDIRQMPLDELRAAVSVLFQFPVPYHATASQNIAIGDLKQEATSTDIEMAARFAGVHEAISRLPNGYNTLLGKWFPGGTELSGGEWQKIGLARAFLRQAPLLILDEPTSFMDSWAEIEWLERFRSLAIGRTAIIITHRFTTAMRADRIYVMSEGEIVESGSHGDLVASGGLYAQSWEAQMKFSGDLVGYPG